MNDPDSPMTWPAGIDELQEPPWAPLGLTLDEEPLRANPTGALISLAFIWQALGRARRVWCAVAVLGLLLGCAFYLRYPPAYHAQASVLVADSLGIDPEIEILTDQSIAQSQPVAASVVQELGLQQTVASFQAAYTVTVVTPQVLTFDVGAPTSAGAVQRVAALASSYLAYRAKYERIQEQQQVSQLASEYTSAQQSLQTTDAEISQLPSTQLTPAQSTELDKLQTQAANEKQTMQYATTNEASTKASIEAMLSGSHVLNPATLVTHSRLKGAALYVLGGLLGGLAVGMGIVIVVALLSDRLRRRDDVADALGAPVRLSIAALRAPSRWPSLRPRRTARRDRDLKRVIAYLQGAVPGSPHGPASLAVVAVDDPQTVAVAVAALARSIAQEGKQVVVADLSVGRPLARLLGSRAPGVHPVTHDGLPLQLVVPGRDDVAPVGPVLRGSGAPAIWTQPDEAVVTACASADLLLTLVTLDPGVGGDHLATWASAAIAVVTAGRSSAEKVHGVGEMIRLAGTRLDSVVLIGADRSDVSLGLLDPARPSGDSAGEREAVDP